MHSGVCLMPSKKGMVFEDVCREPGTLTYQYCEWESRAEDIMAVDIKAIVHDVRGNITEHG